LIIVNISSFAAIRSLVLIPIKACRLETQVLRCFLFLGLLQWIHSGRDHTSDR